jgi:hypothetical protein
VKSSINDLEPATLLWIGERVVSVLPFELRKLRESAKERSERLSEPEGDGLKDLTVNLLEILVFFATAVRIRFCSKVPVRFLTLSSNRL